MKKGFTLIELLAVIVILAIIALIATPIVLDIIEDSKNSSIKRSIELYADAVENSVAKAQLNGSVVPSGKYTTTDGKTLTNGETKIKVDYDGAKTVCDVYISSEGTVSLKKCNVSDKTVEYTYGNKIYENGDVVYFNVASGTKCTSSDYMEANSNTGYNGINPSSEQTSCLKFYAFNDFGSDKLNLILDHNTTALIAWNSSASNVNGPSEGFLNKLNEYTKDWQGTETPSNYTMDQAGQTSNANYTIDYSTYKARLITANEIATITGNTTFNETTASYYHWYYFDSKTDTASTTCKRGDTSGCSYGWLYDRTSTNCTEYGCLNNSDQTTYGYWTASSIADNTHHAWFVTCSGDVFRNTVAFSDHYGVRPVIEVLRSKLI